jgi:hypothetical protein
MQTRTKTMFLAAAALSMVVAALPTAHAQTTTLKLEVTSIGTIKPDVEVKQFTVTATYSFGSPAQSGVVATNANIVVQLTFSGCPPGVTIGGQPSILVPLQAGQTSAKGSTTFTISASRDVPGLKPLNCKLAGVAKEVANNAAVPAANSGEQAIAFTVGYFPLVQAKVASKVQEAGPQKQIPFSIDLENKGNAQTRITFTLQGEDHGNWNPLVPEALVLDSFADPSGKTTDTTVFSIATPFHNGWNNEEKAFQLVMTPVAAGDPTQPGNILTANVLARVRGIYVPGPEPFLLVAAVLGAALLARMATGRDE